MDFIMIPAIIGICTFGLYKLIELFARRRERIMIIEKTDFSDSENKSIDVNIGSSEKFGAIRIGCLFMGIGLGLLIAFILGSSMELSGINETRGRVTEILGILYGGCVFLFGGIGLIVSFIIEKKYWNKG